MKTEQTNRLSSHFGAFGMALGGYTGMFLGFAVHWTYMRRRVIQIANHQHELVLFSSYLVFSLVCMGFSGASVQVRVAAGVGMLGLLYFGVGTLVHETTTSALGLLRGSMESS